MLEATLDGYKLGKIGYLEVLDAQRTMANARLQYLNALTEFHLSVADLEQLTGEKIRQEVKHE